MADDAVARYDMAIKKARVFSYAAAPGVHQLQHLEAHGERQATHISTWSIMLRAKSLAPTAAAESHHEAFYLLGLPAALVAYHKLVGEGLSHAKTWCISCFAWVEVDLRKIKSSANHLDCTFSVNLTRQRMREIWLAVA